MGPGRLKELLTVESDVEAGRSVRLYVDGPFGGPLVDVLHSRVAVLIAGGIGISPYLSVIHHLM